MRKRTIRRIARAGISLGLAGVMGLINPANTLAASQNNKTEYVSEVRISTAKKEGEAKKWLKDNGYKVQEQNLNDGTGEDAVYLGYKTTTKQDEAITDMAVMEMKGGYSISEYEMMLEEQKKGVKEMVSCLQNTLKEYRDNYSKGTPGAKEAYEKLNQLKEDDSGKLMGDFLLDESLSEDDLVKVIMQGNSIALVSIYYGLAVACSETENDNWLIRLSESDPDEDYSAKYDEKARDIYENQWDTFQDGLQSYLDSGMTLDSPEKDLEEWREEISETSYATWLQNANIYNVLDLYPYGEGTLADFFAKEKADLDIEELFPLVAAMTEGQREIVNMVGFTYMVQVAGASKAAWKKADEQNEEVVEEYIEQEEKDSGDDVSIPETVSIYAGVDRSLFDGSVALTSDALRKSASTGDTSWYAGNIDSTTETILYSIAGSIAGLGVLVMLFTPMYSIFLNALIKYELLNEWVRSSAIAVNNFFEAIANFFNLSETTTNLAMTNTFGLIALGIALIVASVYVGLELYNYYHPKYTDIPRILVDEKKDEQGKVTYLNYYAVKDQNDQYADLNAWKAKQWNALYTTKDKDAGDPITTDMLCQEGNNTAKEGYSTVHAFGEKAAFNLNSHCYDDDVNGIYMFFARYDAAAYTASAFGTGTIVLVAGFGVLCGIIVGSFFTAMAGRRKRKTANA